MMVGTSGLYWHRSSVAAPGEVDERADVYSLGIMIYEKMPNRATSLWIGRRESLSRGICVIKEPPPI